MRRSATLRVWTALLAATLVMAACGGGTEEPAPAAGSQSGSAELMVLATTTILGDLVRGVAGDNAIVEVLLPIGADPHDFQASSQDGVKIRTADLVVANGLSLEESLIAVFESARQDGARILEVGGFVDPLEWGEGKGVHDKEEGEEDEDEDEEEHGGGFDPHFWFDPSRVEQAVRLIAAELAEVGGGLTAEEWTSRGERYIEVIRDAAAEAEEILAVVPSSQRKLVTNHDSFSYFGVYFGFEILDTILSGGSTLAQPGTDHLAQLVEILRAEGAPAIFTETTASSGFARTIAAEFDPPLEVVELRTGSLGPPGSDADTYPKWIVANVRLIAEALTR